MYVNDTAVFEAQQIQPSASSPDGTVRTASVYVGIDGSGASSAALQWAVHNCVAAASTLVLVHVVDDDWEERGEDLAGEAERHGKALLEEAKARSGGWWTKDVRTTLLHGSPTETLAGLAGNDDLLVIGSHKTGYLHGLALGSTSVQVLAATAGSVAVIPNVPVNHRRDVVVGVDDSPDSVSAVLRAAEEAARLSRPLLIVHARRTVPAQWESADSPESVDIAARLMLRARELAASVAPTLEVTTKIISQSAAIALLRAADGASLLVLGGSGRPGRGGIGAVVHDIAMNLSLPLLVVRATP